MATLGGTSLHAGAMKTAVLAQAAALEAALGYSEDLYRIAYTLTGSVAKAERLVEKAYEKLDLKSADVAAHLAGRLIRLLRREQRWAVTFSWMRHDDGLVESVRRLPLGEAEALLLRDILNLPVAAIAACCEIAAEEAAARIARARLKLVEWQKGATPVLEASAGVL